ncbi:MAG: hypothetical protein ACR2ID_11105 [Chthoniobacterales bacterium]
MSGAGDANGADRNATVNSARVGLVPPDDARNAGTTAAGPTPAGASVSCGRQIVDATNSGRHVKHRRHYRWSPSDFCRMPQRSKV